MLVVKRYKQTVLLFVSFHSCGRFLIYNNTKVIKNKKKEIVFTLCDNWTKYASLTCLIDLLAMYISTNYFNKFIRNVDSKLQKTF